MSVETATGIQHDPPMQEMPTAVLPCVQAFMPSTGGPALDVRWQSSQRRFQPGRDIVVGRDQQADIRVESPLISRVHLIMRFVDGRWVAIDNGSLNGMFVGGRRMSSVAITDGKTINIGEPDGPPMTFGVAQTDSERTAGRAPAPKSLPPRRRMAMPGAMTVGRTPDNDIVVADVLASRHHAMLVPTQGDMRDPRRRNPQRHVRQRRSRRGGVVARG